MNIPRIVMFLFAFLKHFRAIVKDRSSIPTKYLIKTLFFTADLKK